MDTSTNSVHSKVNIYPTRDRLLLKMKTKTTQSEGGIYLPENRKEKAPMIGTVIATGPISVNDDKEIDMDYNHPEIHGAIVMKGDRVIIATNAGIVLDDPAFVIVERSEVLAVLK